MRDAVHARISAALAHIPADDRDTWLRMAMAVKAELGEAGFDLWDAWSQGADAYSPADARDVWRSVNGVGKVTAGSLFHEAKARGWRDTEERSPPTPEELAERRRLALERAAREQAELERARADCSAKAAALWRAARPALADHPYLLRKAVAPVGTLREIGADAAADLLGYVPKASGEPLAGRLLVVPIKIDNRLSTLELIDGDGRKTALKGRGTKAGGYWAAQPLPEGDGTGATLLLGEGVATVLSAREATGHAAVAALSAGNLATVAQTMRGRYAKARLIVLADLAKATGAPDPHALEAARAVGGMLAVPAFGPDREPGQTDFNDLAQARGLEAVRLTVEGGERTARVNGSAQPQSPTEAADWPAIEPLPDGLPPVEPFDLALLPEALRPWIADIAERMQCPPDYPAVAAMVCLAAVVGRQVAIRPKRRDDWTVTPNLWGAVVGRPSLLKTPAIQEPLRMVEALEARAREEHERAERHHAADVTVAKTEAKEAEKKIAKAIREGNAPLAHALALEATEAPEAPARRRYLTHDATIEKLGELLRDNPRGVLLSRDELVGFLRSLDQEGREGSRAFFLEAWNGCGRFTFDRIGRGTIEIEAACISVIGGIQPGPLGDYMLAAIRGGRGDDGLVQRFQLAVWPDAPREWRNVDRYPDTAARRAARAVYERLDGLGSGALGAQQGRATRFPGYASMRMPKTCSTSGAPTWSDASVPTTFIRP